MPPNRTAGDKDKALLDSQAKNRAKPAKGAAGAKGGKGAKAGKGSKKKGASSRRLAPFPIASFQDTAIGLGRRVVTVQVIFVHIGEIDTLAETFDAEINLYASWREPALDKKAKVLDSVLEKSWNPHLYIENIVKPPTVDVKMKLQQSAKKEAIVLEHKTFIGTFVANMKLVNFPFDVQELLLIVKSNLPCTDLILREDPDAPHKLHKRAFVDEQKYYLLKYATTVPEPEPSEQFDDESTERPRLFVMFAAARRWQYYVKDIFFFVFLLGMILMLQSFVMDTNFMAVRLQLVLTAILGLVTFKGTITSLTPRTSSLNCIEKYYVGTLVIALVVGFYQGTITRMDPLPLRQVDLYALYAYCGLCLLYNICFYLWIVKKPCAPRRQMFRNEKLYQEDLAKDREEEGKHRPGLQRGSFEGVKHRQNWNELDR